MNTTKVVIEIEIEHEEEKLQLSSECKKVSAIIDDKLVAQTDGMPVAIAFEYLGRKVAGHLLKS